MKQKLLSMLLVICLVLTACGENESTSSSSEEAELQSKSQEKETPITSEIDENETVEIIMSMFSFGSTTIEDYVKNMNEEEGTEKYQVYDGSHYSFFIPNEEREILLDEIKNDETFNEYFSELFSDADTYNDAFIRVEHDEDFKEIDFYVDKTKYDSAGFPAVFGPLIMAGMVSDSVQAYALVPVESRDVIVRIIDNENGNILYDSSKE